MTDPVSDPGEEATLFPKSAGERLREAREAQGLSLAEIAARTRIPIRQLEAIENSDYAQLPTITYAVGFARSYARAVGLDEVAIAREVRGTSERSVRRPEYEAYEITDPARVPSRGVAIFGVLAALVLIVAAGIWFGTSWFRGGENAPAAAPIAETVPEAAPTATSPAPAPAAAPGGQVTLTATDEVWLRVYDATGKKLYQNTLKAGDHYDVPPDANGPMINVGRPDKLQVTVGGVAVPPLGSGRTAIKDVGISAAALAARPAQAPGATPTSASSPTLSSSPTTKPSPRRTSEPRAAPTTRALNIAAPAPASTPAPAATATPTP